MRPLLLLLVICQACTKPAVRGIATIEETEAPLKSAIRASDPQDEPQLVAGFYPAEHDGWRWTRRQFRFVLEAPADAAERGATLELVVDAPPAVLDLVGPVTLTATVGGISLAPETRDKPGIRAYTRAVPASAFARRETLVEVTLDKAVKPFTTPGEDRELGLAMHRAALAESSSEARTSKAGTGQ